MSSNQRPSISRRAFLEGVGKVGGSAAVYRSMAAMGLVASSTAACDFSLEGATDFDDLNPRSERFHRPRVAILGAGIAGLTAAYELRRAGYDCRIIEARNRAGGRNETIRRGDIVEETDSMQQCQFRDGPNHYLNTGPARIPYHHNGILGYCRKFGVALEVFNNDNRAAFFHNRNQLNGEAVPARVIHTDVRGHVSSLLAKALSKGALDDELDSNDRAGLLNLLRSFGALGPGDVYQGSSRAGYADSVNAGHGSGAFLNPIELRSLLQTDFWIYKMHFSQFNNQNPTLLQPVGGMDQIVRAFERRVGSVIRYGREVTEIRKRENGVRIIYQNRHGQERKYDADYAIVTIPATVLRDIESDISADYKTEIAGMQYSKALKIAFEARRFWERDDQIYGGISWTDQDITQIWYPASGYHERSGVIVGAYIWDDGPAIRVADLSPKERLKLGIEQGERIHPQFRDEARRGISRSWLKTPYSLGSWNAGNPPVLLAEPDDRIYFAGEHMNPLSGWQEASVISAHQTVQKIHEHATS